MGTTSTAAVLSTVPIAPPAQAVGVRYLDEIFTTVTKTSDVVYGQALNYNGATSALKLDTYAPDGDTETGRPALVYIHGGYFSAGDKSEGSTWATLAAKRGYFAVSINYRVWPGASSDLAKLQWAIPSALHDSQAAIRWLRANATSLGINPTAIVVMGYSAGAVTSVNLAYRPFDLTNSNFAPVDPGPGSNPVFASDVLAVAPLAGAGGPPVPNAPPLMMFNGSSDTVVPYASAVQTCNLAASAGDECTMNTYPTAHDLSPYFADIRAKTWQFFYGKVVPRLSVARTPAGYHPIAAFRVLDTRDGTGGTTGPVPGGSTIEVGVTGAGGVPSSGVSGIVLNVTGVGSGDQPTHVTVWASGGARPNASNLNLAPRQTAANLVTSPVGSGGAVSLFNNSGSIQLIADAVGWYDDGSAGGTRFNSITPARLLDTRNGTGGVWGPLSAGTTVSVTAAGTGGIPADAQAVVTNLTAVDPSADTHLTAFAAGSPVPSTSNLNVVAGQTRPNLAILAPGTAGRISIRNNAGNVNALADATGFFRDTGTRFVPVTPSRILDTRDGTGGTLGPVGAGSTIRLLVRGRGGVPIDGAAAVAVNVTAVGPTAVSYVAVFAGGTAMPATSALNLRPGETVPNFVMGGLGGDGSLSLYNNSGQTHLLADIVGYFV